MVIRKARSLDSASIGKLVKSLSHLYLENRQSPLPAAFASSLTDSAFVNRINSPQYSNFVYEINAEIVGYIAIHGDSHLYHLFVAEHLHGQGVAKKLWMHVLNTHPAVSYTVNSSVNAIAVYRRFGFRETGPMQDKDGLRYQPMEMQL